MHARPDVVVLDGAGGAGRRPARAGRRATKLVVDAAKAGHHVVRLDRRRPGLFGGLAEEARPASRRTSRSRSCPGVSAVTAVPTYAGIPLTDSPSQCRDIVLQAEDLRRLVAARRPRDDGRRAVVGR